MLYKTVMALGVVAMIWCATWFYRVYAGMVVLDADSIPPMVIGGIAGGIGAYFFVPWLMKREAAKRAER